jgi:membrane protease YdiL (CAAX protease family)
MIASLVYGIAYAASNWQSISANPLSMLEGQSLQWLVAFALLLTFALIVLTIVYVRFIEKRSIASMGLVRQSWLGRYALGYVLGLGLAAVSTALPLWVVGPVQVNGFSMMVIVFFIVFIIQSASEEIFFRGFLMPSIGAKIGVFWGVIISSFVFALAHIFNPGMTLTGLVTIFFVGVFLALYILRTGSIFGACAIHAAWNFGTGLITAISISGYMLDYAVVQLGDVTPVEDVNILGSPIDFIAIGVFLVGIALLLFAGKRRLVVPAPEAMPEGEAAPPLL